MELRRRAGSPLTLEATPVDQRRDPKTRRRLSAPALRSFFRIAEAWRLSGEQQRALLGWPPESTFYKYKAGQTGTLAFDMLVRISLLLGIYKDLHILYPDRELADGWIHLPNSNPLFGGQSAIAFITEGGIDSLYQVRRLLDSRRGAWN